VAKNEQGRTGKEGEAGVQDANESFAIDNRQVVNSRPSPQRRKKESKRKKKMQGGSEAAKESALRGVMWAKEVRARRKI
jgi:hypothetical protein